MARVLQHPWLRLVLGVLAAGAVGVLAARIAGPSPSGDPVALGSGAGAGAPGEARGGAGRGDSGSGGGGSGGGVSVSSGGGEVTVHVAGAVRRPGVYELREGARVQEAVRKAGGASRGADREGLNLAAEVRDGQQVLVPERTPPGGGGGGASAADAPVDLNAASPEELDGLEGVGPTTAEKIVAFREERGGLAGVDDLDDIPGIGPKKLESLREQLGG